MCVCVCACVCVHWGIMHTILMIQASVMKKLKSFFSPKNEEIMIYNSLILS